MKRTLLSLCLIAASSAVFANGVTAIATPATSAQKACDGAVAGSGKTKVYGGDGATITGTTYFVQQGFTVQCSSNVTLYFQESSPTLAVVASASMKGNQVFGGSSNGGAMSSVLNCTGTACAESDVSGSGLSNALSSATSSGS